MNQTRTPNRRRARRLTILTEIAIIGVAATIGTDARHITAGHGHWITLTAMITAIGVFLLLSDLAEDFLCPAIDRICGIETETEADR